MENDVARAHFEAPVARAIAVELPQEDGGGKDLECGLAPGVALRDQGCSGKLPEGGTQIYATWAAATQAPTFTQARG